MKLGALISGLGRALRGRVIEGAHPSNNGFAWSSIFGGSEKIAGVEMDEWKALNLDTVWACITSIAADTAKVPLHLYKSLSPAGRERLTTHPTARLILRRPNPEMSAFTFRETLQGHVLAWGNGYAEIERDGSGRPLALWPLRPDRMRVKRDEKTKKVVYEYTSTRGGVATLAPESVLHIKGLGFDGLVGYNVIRVARESMAGAKAAADHGRRHFAQGGVPPLVLSHPGILKGDTPDKMRQRWQETYGGVENAGKVAILEEGLKVEKLGLPLEESQFLETRQFSVPEICRWFRYPPHKAMDLSRATFSNIEQQDLSYAGDTLLPWWIRWEQELWHQLLSEEEQAELYFEALWEATLRVDTPSRYKAYKDAVDGGWMSVDEVRERENLNPLPNGEGAIYRFPGNMITSEAAAAGEFMRDAGTARSEAPPDDPPAGDPEPKPKDKPQEKPEDRAKRAAEVLERVGRSAAPMLEAAIRDLMRLEADKARRAAKRGELAAWAAAFYPAHVDQVRARFFPAVESSVRAAAAAVGGEVDVGALVLDLATAYVATNRREVEAAKEAGLERVADDWEKDRAATYGETFAARLGQGMGRSWKAKVVEEVK